MTDELKILSSLIFRNSVLPMIIFVILINMTPNYDSLTQFYFTNILHFDPNTLAQFQTVAAVAYMLGLIVYMKYFTSSGPKKVIFTTNIILWMINISFLLVVFGIIEKLGMGNKLFCFFN